MEPRTLKSVPAAPSDKDGKAGRQRRGRGSPAGSGGVASRSRRRNIVLAVVGFVLVALVIALVIVVNSDVFLVTDVQINAGENVDQETLEQLVDVPDDATLFNVDEDAITESLMRSPWISSVTIERELPGTLIITPVERTAALLVYINTDDVAWLVSDDGVWITPVSLSTSSDEESSEDSTEGDAAEVVDESATDEEESTDSSTDSDEDASEEEAEDLEGESAALEVASLYGALLVTDVPTDVDPVAGEAVESEEVLAALTYVQEFSDEFLEQVKSFSAASVEALSANLEGGVEVALGEAEDIATKEKVVTKLLEQEEGVTYINVREADAYTFRSTPSE